MSVGHAQIILAWFTILVTQTREYCVLQMCLNYVNSALMSSLTGIELRNTFQAPV